MRQRNSLTVAVGAPLDQASSNGPAPTTLHKRLRRGPLRCNTATPAPRSGAPQLAAACSAREYISASDRSSRLSTPFHQAANCHRTPPALRPTTAAAPKNSGAARRAYIRDTAREKGFRPGSPGARPHNACPHPADIAPRDARAPSPPIPREAATLSCSRSSPPGLVRAPRDRRED